MSLSVVPFTSKETTPLVDFFAGWKKEAENSNAIQSVLVLACMKHEGEEGVGLVIEQGGQPLKLVEVIGLLELAKYDVTTSHDPE